MEQLLALITLLSLSSLSLFALEADAGTVQDNLNYVWTIIAACMVFFIQAGFTLVGTAFTRAKNALNIVMKNVMDVSASGLAFFFLGFGLMFGSTAGGWIGTDGFALTIIGDYSAEWSWTFFFFQAMFAATAAMLITWVTTGKPDGEVTLNRVLAGSVGITAGCANLTPTFAILTVVLAGILVHYSMKFLEKYVDDAVGAVSVRGVCGAWGTLAAGMFNTGDLFKLEQMGVQMIGVRVAFV
tara:strand:- start:2633 stop:3355 length:723 start_codon:yes stop_codon:yes gene_type:complete